MKRLVVLALGILFFSLSCVSGPDTASNQSSPVATVKLSDPQNEAPPETEIAPQSTTISTGNQVQNDIDTLVQKAKDSIEANRLSEGLKFYISALGRASKAGLREKVSEISSILNQAGTKLTIEPHESWIAPDGSQVAADVRAASHGEGLMPAVYLYESYGFGKSVVPDAMVRFEFVENEGTLTSSVSTDARGLANSTISSIASPGREAIIRAFPIFTSEGFTFAFKTVFRDFTFVAPPNIAIVLTLEQTPAGYSGNPRVMDAVASSLKPLGVEIVPFNGIAKPERFMEAFSGDRVALESFAGSTKPGYFAIVFVEVPKPTQMVLQGKVYNIFTTNGKATIRLVRLDGTIVYAEARDGIKGQGGSEQGAVDDCLVKIRDEITTLLEDRRESIQKALAE